jgi:hypothetical protein
LAVERRSRRHQKVIAARSSSSRVSPSLQDVPDYLDHAIDFTVTFRIPYTSPLTTRTTGMLSPFHPVPQPRRRRLLRRAEILGEPHLSQIISDLSDLDLTILIESLTELVRVNQIRPISF